METLRELNTCGKCDHEWYPRGHDQSKKCPHCGSTHVSLVEYEQPFYSKGMFWGVVATALAVGLVLPIPVLSQTSRVVVGVPCILTEAAVTSFVTNVDTNVCGTVFDM